MPEVEKVNVSYSRKVQLDDFEPVEHFAELEVSLEDGDDPDEVYDEYSEQAEDMVERAIANRVTAKMIDSDE
jgi:hypothetical protein